MLFSLYMTLPLLLSEEFGYSDTAAGTVVGAIGGMMGFYAVVLCTIVDKIGVKKSALISSIIATIAGVLITIVK